MTHLDALNLNLSHERARLADSKSQGERDLRSVWVAQLEKEIAAERAFLGLDDVKTDAELMSEDELLAELLS